MSMPLLRLSHTGPTAWSPPSESIKNDLRLVVLESTDQDFGPTLSFFVCKFMDLVLNKQGFLEDKKGILCARAYVTLLCTMIRIRAQGCIPIWDVDLFSLPDEIVYIEPQTSLSVLQCAVVLKCGIHRSAPCDAELQLKTASNAMIIGMSRYMHQERPTIPVAIHVVGDHQIGRHQLVQRSVTSTIAGFGSEQEDFNRAVDALMKMRSKEE